MGGYLKWLAKEPTGSPATDKIMQTLADAGDSFHHTEGWNDSEYTDDAGKTWAERIHAAACDAAAEAAALRAEVARLRDELQQAANALSVAQQLTEPGSSYSAYIRDHERQARNAALRSGGAS